MRRLRSPLHLIIIGLTLLSSFGAAQFVVYSQTSTIVVTSTIDSDLIPSTSTTCPNPCTFRQALRVGRNITNAGGNVTIEFNIPAATPGQMTWVITPTTALGALPPITSNIIVDGTSQERRFAVKPNPNGPEVIIDGTNINTQGGIRIDGNNSTVKGLGIINFQNGLAGILIKGNNNIIQGNYIGVNATGTAAAPNQGPGIEVEGTATGNIIGGSNLDDTQRNLISGNASHGIRLRGSSSGTIIRGNFIGTDRLGTTALPNQLEGVYIFGTSGNIIGPDSTNSDSRFGNVISGNGGRGIYIDGSSNNQINGNDIGLDAFIFNPLPNGTALTGAPGILIASNSTTTISNTIGGPDLSLRNYIAAHSGPGIYILGDDVSQTRIINNVIGLNKNNDLPGTIRDGNGNITTPGAPNQSVGILIEDGADTTTIGGAGDARNIIGGIVGDGIRIQGSLNPGPVGAVNRPSNTNAIIGNCIGIVPAFGSNGACTTAQPNQGNGVNITNNAQGNRVGGADFNEANLIINNLGDGIRITGPEVRDTVVGANYIDRNTGNGINIAGGGTIGDIYVRNTSITGAGETVDKLTRVYKNGSHGIVATNAISISVSFAVIYENSGNGVFFNSSVQNGTVRSSSIVANQLSGVAALASTNTTLTKLRLQDNLAYGVIISNTVTTKIDNSLIFTNTLDGIYSWRGNTTAINLNTILGNKANGVRVDGDGNPISRVTDIERNTITDNGANGVLVTRSASARAVEQVKILTNLFTRNTLKAIELDPETSGLPGDSTMPNRDIDPPVFDVASPQRLRLSQNGMIAGFVLVPTSPPAQQPDVNPPPACVQPCRIQIFKPNPALQVPDGEGHTLIGETSTAANGAFEVQLTDVPPLPPQILLTATDGYGNTSEYASFTTVYSMTITAPQTKTAFPGDSVTYIHQVTNAGTVDLTNLQVVATSSQGWPVTVAVQRPQLAAGATSLVTVTLSLPSGAAANVRSGIVDKLTVTASSELNPTTKETISASLVDSTTVLGRFIFAVNPLSRNGSGAPGRDPNNPTRLDYVHTLTNSGNVTGTVTLTPTTDLGDPPWTTTLTARSVVLGPGESKDVTLRVTIPFGAQGGTVATTTVDITGPDGAKATVTDKTTITIVQAAILSFAQELEGAAGKTTTFCHQATNLSNGPATFKLNGGSALGSQVSFRSNQSGVTLGADNTFTVSNAEGSNTFSFCVDVTLPRQLLPNQNDSVTIFLTLPDGTVIGGASLIDTVRVVQAEVFPRLWLPVIFR